MFVANRESKFRDVLDGLSNTIAMGEIITDLGDRDVRGKMTWGTTITAGTQVRDNPSICVDSAMVDPLRPRFWVAGLAGVGSSEGRGYKWADYRPTFSGFNTIHPPNSAICGFRMQEDGNLPASSQHQGGAHILMGDGAVIFMTDSVEAGDSRNPNVWLTGAAATFNMPGAASPYGLWGALGTRATKEVIEEDLDI